MIRIVNSSVDRAFASGDVDHRFDPRPRHTKGNKMVIAASLLTLATKGSARKIQGR